VDRCRPGIGKAHGAVARQSGFPDIRGGRHHGAQNAARPPAQPIDRLDMAGGGADHDRCHAGEVDPVALHHAQRHADGTAGVDGIAARFQHGKPGGGCKIMPR